MGTTGRCGARCGSSTLEATCYVVLIINMWAVCIPPCTCTYAPRRGVPRGCPSTSTSTTPHHTTGNVECSSVGMRRRRRVWFQSPGGAYGLVIQHSELSATPHTDEKHLDGSPAGPPGPTAPTPCTPPRHPLVHPALNTGPAWLRFPPVPLPGALRQLRPRPGATRAWC